MRFRFSLRTFFVLTTCIAAFCYYWLVLPTITAQQFISRISAKDYRTADEMFIDSKDRFMASWGKKHWAFQTEALLVPLTLAQLVRGQRDVDMSIAYFELDQNVARNVRVAATPRGLKSPQFVSENRVSVTIGTEGASTGIER